MTKRFIKRPRMTGFSYRGRVAYHLVLVTNDRQPLLVGDLAYTVQRQLRDGAAISQFELLAFTIMPDHLHVLACGHDHEADAVAFIQRFKQRTSYDHIRAQANGSGSRASTITPCGKTRTSNRSPGTSSRIPCGPALFRAESSGPTRAERSSRKRQRTQHRRGAAKATQLLDFAR